MDTKEAAEVDGIPKFYANSRALAKGEVVVTYRDHLSEISLAVAKENDRICKLLKTVGATGTEEEVDKLIVLIKNS